MMKELFEKGYKVIVGSPYGDMQMLDLDDIEIYSDASLVEINHEAKTVYFYDKIWEC